MGRNSEKTASTCSRLISKYAELRGISKTAFTEEALKFVMDSKTRHHVHKMVNSIYRYLSKTRNNFSLDIKSAEGRRALYGEIARICLGNDKDAAQQYIYGWSSGLWDIDYFKLSAFFGPGTIERPPNATSRMEWRYSIARTLTYIRTRPPIDSDIILSSYERLFDCWEFIKKHPHYNEKRNGSPTRRINQHCIDEVYFRYPKNPDIIIGPEAIGRFRVMMEAGDSQVSNWWEAWTIFRAITSEPQGIASGTMNLWLPGSEPLWKDM